MERKWTGHLTEWMRVDDYSPCVLVLHVLSEWAHSCRALHAACRQGRQCGPLRSAYWPMVLCSATRRRGPRAHACGAGEDVFHTRGDRRREGAPAWAGEGRQKEGRSGFLQATPNRFPGKMYLHTQDSATSYLSELWHVFIEQMDNFLRAFLQKFQPINLRTWALFRLLFDSAADGASSGSRWFFLMSFNSQRTEVISVNL